MQRREFITLFGGTAATWPLAARAQQPAKMKRIAIVSPATKIGDMGANGHRIYRMFFEELSRLGYDEGRNLDLVEEQRPLGASTSNAIHSACDIIDGVMSFTPG